MANAVRVIISGRVQGVSYRAWTTATARGLGLNGWVRNLSDGTVEAVFSGEETVVQSMIEACKQGSPSARVERIEIFRWDEKVDAGFMSKPTV